MEQYIFHFLSLTWHYIKPINQLNYGTYIKANKNLVQCLETHLKGFAECRPLADWPPKRPKGERQRLFSPLSHSLKWRKFAVPSTRPEGSFVTFSKVTFS